MAKIWLRNPTKDDPEGKWIDSNSPEGQAYRAGPSGKTAGGANLIGGSTIKPSTAVQSGASSGAASQLKSLLGLSGVSGSAGAPAPVAAAARPTAGAGTGGTAAPSSYGATLRTEQNPYLKQLMEKSIAAFDTPLNREAERAMTRREGSLAMREARQLAGRGGGMGMWGAQQQSLANTQAQARAGQEAGFGTREAELRKQLISSMTGVGEAGTRDTAMQLAAQQAQAELAQKSAQATQDYQFRYDDLAERARQGRMSSLSDLLRLI